ncbi:MAG: lipid II:glycine glycyltransferase FemX, partial [Anaerolineales bacterium]
EGEMGGEIPKPSIDPEGWNRLIASLPEAHVLQTWEWGSVKSRFGWEPIYCIWTRAGERIALQHTLPAAHDSIVGAALVLRRTASVRGIRVPLRILYAPKGPLLADWGDQSLRERVLADLAGLARRSGAMMLKVDPDVQMGKGVPGSPLAADNRTGTDVRDALGNLGWIYSEDQVQFRNTVIVDLRPSSEDLLGRMKQKTRYNVRLAERKGVRVREGSLGDLDLLYQMYAETSLRDGFVIRDAGYYEAVWRTFMAAGIAEALIAEVEQIPVAAIILFKFANKSWYFYGMSRQAHREKMPNHLLQWEAMRRAKSAGCLSYDLWGAPDNFDESDPLWGVYRFKEGFAGEVVRHLGAWDLPVRPALYRFYTRLLPRILDRMRRRGMARLEQTQGMQM